MSLVTGALPYFLLPLVLAFILVPFCKMIGLELGVYAVENKRTVHHGKIVRMGGVGIFMAFLIGMAVLNNADATYNGIMIGGSIVFFGGLIDDMVELKPKTKLLFEIAGAIVAMALGNIYLTEINLPFGITIANQLFCWLVSFVWIIGVTNAVNLIDGLDGLCAGISFIVCCIIGLLGFFMGRRDMCIISLTLAGAILGFLPYNSHPASVFMGDCGALFLGFTLACMSLLGFKTTAIITLGFPVLMLFIPISDTLIAMLRRKLKGQGIMQADKGHLHHVLMLKLRLGHGRTVLVLYMVTALFGASALLTYFRPTAGLAMVIILIVVAELFIEATGMINPKFHPVIGLARRFTGLPKHCPFDDDLADTKEE